MNIIFTNKADQDEIAIYKYITETFGQVYANKFRQKLIALLNVPASQSFIGRPAKNDKSLRVIMIGKQNKIVYKVAEEDIIIIRILNTKTGISENF